MKIIIICSLAGFAILYLLASFTLWDFNASNWPEPARFGVFSFGFIFGAFVGGLIQGNKPK